MSEFLFLHNILKLKSYFFKVRMVLDKDKDKINT